MLTNVANLASLDAKLNPAKNTLRSDDAKGSADVAKENLNAELDNFLTLLTTQLQNQDPTEPLDTNEMTAQIVQFTGVEQQVNTNKKLETLISQNSSQQVNNAVSFIGKEVTAEGDQTVLQGGKANLTFEVPAGASNVTVAVLDKFGKVVFTDSIKPEAGLNNYTWDGSSSFGSSKLADGIYNFGVAAKDSKGELLSSQTYTSEVVTSVSLKDGEPLMRLGGEIDLALSDITTVKERAVTPPVTPPVAKTGTEIE